MKTKMIRSFIELPLFTKRWHELGFNDEDMFQLQDILLKNPEAGRVMQGTGGIRKVRFAFENRGKSGSVRICYVDFASYTVIYLITAFSKDEQDNLTQEQKNVLKKLVKTLKDEAGRSCSG